MKTMADIADESRQRREFKMFKENIMSFKSCVTNADHIRSMTNEELAKTIILSQQTAVQYVVEQMGSKAPPPDEINEGDYIRMLDWLKLPYKEVSK